MRSLLVSHVASPEFHFGWAARPCVVSQAPFLVDLGDHPLPSRVPWRNLQVLLRKEKVTIPNKDIFLGILEGTGGICLLIYSR